MLASHSTFSLALFGIMPCTPVYCDVTRCLRLLLLLLLQLLLLLRLLLLLLPSAVALPSAAAVVAVMMILLLLLAAAAVSSSWLEHKYKFEPTATPTAATFLLLPLFLEVAYFLYLTTHTGTGPPCRAQASRYHALCLVRWCLRKEAESTKCLLPQPSNPHVKKEEVSTRAE